MRKENFNEFIDNIAVVLVLYNTDIYKCDAYISLQNSLKQIDNSLGLTYLVYDNSLYPDERNLDQFVTDDIFYEHNSENPGLSKPSNDGAVLAKKMGKEWVLFTNPDTFYDINYFKVLFKAYLENSQFELFAPILISQNNIVSPANYKYFIGSSPQNVQIGSNELDNKLLLYSGMFISISAFEKSRRFNDLIKLDFMDCYFSENYRKIFKTFFLIDIKCEHDLSSSETDSNKVLRRFGYYCEGAYYFSQSRKEHLQLFTLCLLRGFKLGFKFNRIKFILIPFKMFLKKR